MTRYLFVLIAAILMVLFFSTTQADRSINRQPAADNTISIAIPQADATKAEEAPKTNQQTDLSNCPYKYDIENGEISIASYRGSEQNITIPSSIGG
jgi:hypothetical protein